MGLFLHYRDKIFRVKDVAGIPVPLDPDLLFLAETATQQNIIQDLYRIQGERNRSRRSLYDADPNWEEDKHPRNKGGQFTSKGGEGEGGAASGEGEPAPKPQVAESKEVPPHLYQFFRARKYEYSHIESGRAVFIDPAGSTVVYSLGGEGLPYWEMRDKGTGIRYNGNGMGKLDDLLVTLRQGGKYMSPISKHFDELKDFGSGYRMTSESQHAAHFKNKEGDDIVVYSGDSDDPEEVEWRYYSGSSNELVAEGKGWTALKRTIYELPELKSKHEEKVRQARIPVEADARAHAKSLGFDPDKVMFSEENKTFELNGVRMNYAGAAFIHPGPNQGKIIIYHQYTGPKSVKGLVSHEVMHQKFQDALNEYHLERQKQHRDDRGGSKWIMKPDGELRPEYANDYPVYSVIEPLYHRGGMWDKLKESDGVTDYSRDWWKAVNDGKAQVEQAVHETLAEMAFLETTSGSVGTTAPEWRNLYKAVNDLYAAKDDPIRVKSRQEFRPPSSTTPPPPTQETTGYEGYAKPAEAPVQLRPVEERAWSGKEKTNATRLSKQEAGDLGERIALAYIMQHLGLADAKHLNEDRANFPVDLIGDHHLYEVKTGQVSNPRSSQQWRATIGQPGKAETEWLKTLSPEDKAKYNAGKAQKIMDRKHAQVEAYSKRLGRDVQPKTLTIILDPDKQLADVHVVEGFHHRIGYNSELARSGYVGSFRYNPAEGSSGGTRPMAERVSRKSRGRDGSPLWQDHRRLFLWTNRQASV